MTQVGHNSGKEHLKRIVSNVQNLEAQKREINDQIKDIFKESSIGFIEGMELLTNFESSDTNHLVYLFYKEVGT